MLDIKTIKEIIDSHLSHSNIPKKCVISTNPAQISNDKIALTSRGAIDNDDFSIAQYSVFFSKDDPANLQIITDLYLTLKKFIESVPSNGNVINLDLGHLEIKMWIAEEKFKTKSGIFLNEVEVIPCFPLLKYSLEMIKHPVRRNMLGEIVLQQTDEALKFRLNIEVNEYVPDVSKLAGKTLTVRLPRRFCINNAVAETDQKKQRHNIKGIYEDKFSTYMLELKMITVGFEYNSDMSVGSFLCSSDMYTKSSCKWILEEE